MWGERQLGKACSLAELGRRSSLSHKRSRLEKSIRGAEIRRIPAPGRSFTAACICRQAWISLAPTGLNSQLQNEKRNASTGIQPGTACVRAHHYSLCSGKISDIYCVYLLLSKDQREAKSTSLVRSCNAVELRGPDAWAGVLSQVLEDEPH